ncbi:MAG TPA: mechanosensitive ion channel family protein [bacterium]|nr:mechanosensitive ion channel family protein [bacterium]
MYNNFFIFLGQITTEQKILSKGLFNLPVWTQKKIAGVTLNEIIAAIILIFLGFALKKLSDHVFEKHLIPFFKKTKTEIDHLFFEALSKPLGFIILLACISSAFAVLPLPTKPNINGFVFTILKVITALILLWFLFRIIDIGTKYISNLAIKTESKLDEQMVPFISKASKIVLVLIIFLWILQLSGYNISSLLAGLGIGGLAVALGLQDTLANFFGSVAIFADKPFLVGDVVKIGDIQGTVEDIGFRSTRIRTFEATLVSIPNKTIANSIIDNLSKRSKRRVSQTIGLTYNTTPDNMEKAVYVIRNIISNDEGVDPEFIAVNFSDFGSSSLDINVVYFVKGIDFKEYLKVKERINLAIMRKLEELGLSIAFPTRSIYIENYKQKPSNSKKTEKIISKKEGEDLPF